MRIGMPEPRKDHKVVGNEERLQVPTVSTDCEYSQRKEATKQFLCQACLTLMRVSVTVSLRMFGLRPTVDV